MKTTLKQVFPSVAILSFLSVTAAFGQGFSFVPADTVLTDSIGSEIIFNTTVTNLSSSPLTLAFVRIENTLPGQWTSSLCFDVCFAPFVDSIATTPAFGSTPLAPSQSREFSVHVFAASVAGTATVQVIAKDVNNPSDFNTVTFTANASTTSAGFPSDAPLQYHLDQNYPNPWNPTTTISYVIGERGYVVLTVYDILGRRVSTPLDAQQEAGHYTVTLYGKSLSSGTYFYRLQAGSFRASRTMVLAR